MRVGVRLGPFGISGSTRPRRPIRQLAPVKRSTPVKWTPWMVQVAVIAPVVLIVLLALMAQ